MLISECKQAVAQLGFEDTVESEERFVYALNRAVVEINRIRPKEGIFRVYHMPLKNVELKHTRIPKGETREISGIGNGIAIHVGSGSVTASTYGANETTPEDITTITGTGDKFIKDFTQDVKRIALYANKDSFVVYAKIIEGMPTDISSSDIKKAFISQIENSYDLKTKTNDFLSFFPNPEVVRADTRETLVRDKDFAILHDNATLLLSPALADGVYEIKYQAMPETVALESYDETKSIDLDSELVELVPLLTAVYTYMEEEPEKTAICLKRYQEQREEIRYRGIGRGDISYVNKSGW